MIHQFILAAPKPGLSAEAFQEYWRTVHAVQYASRIPQIRKYLIDTRVANPVELGEPQLPHQGIAEIWLANGEEQLASLQTEEFLQGARLDEPKWAAFWLTLVLDTTAHEILPAAAARTDQVVWTVLHKRKPGLALAEYRERSLQEYAPAVAKLPGLRRYQHNHVNDGAYVFGESSFDSVEQLWFDDVEQLVAAVRSPEYSESVEAARAALLDPRYTFSLTGRQHWIIGPEAR
ncbi:EthD domain-containing protein [Actinospica robiniae]|uniref:EthD domain-containing protein n=1 Tax=Actinospica robiniae TaxID=304901 RepID=UPI0004247220|nr:EthD domain-containing protein [Actinospica robiniae]